MSEIRSVLAAAILEVIRSAIVSTESLEPKERSLVIAMLVKDLRARDPESVSVLTLGPPTDPAAIRDPRASR